MAVIGAVEGAGEFIEEPHGTVHVAIEHAQRTLRSGIGEILAGKGGLVHSASLLRVIKGHQRLSIMI